MSPESFSNTRYDCSVGGYSPKATTEGKALNRRKGSAPLLTRPGQPSRNSGMKIFLSISRMASRSALARSARSLLSSD